MGIRKSWTTLALAMLLSLSWAVMDRAAAQIDCTGGKYKPCWNPQTTPPNPTGITDRRNRLNTTRTQQEALLFERLAWWAALDAVRDSRSVLATHRAAVDDWHASAGTYLAELGYGLDGHPLADGVELGTSPTWRPLNSGDTDGSVQDQIYAAQTQFRIKKGEAGETAADYVNTKMIRYAVSKVPTTGPGGTITYPFLEKPLLQLLQEWNQLAVYFSSGGVPTEIAAAEAYVGTVAGPAPNTAQYLIQTANTAWTNLSSTEKAELRQDKRELDVLAVEVGEVRVRASQARTASQRLQSKFSGWGSGGSSFLADINAEFAASAERARIRLQISRFISLFGSSQIFASLNHLENFGFRYDPNSGPGNRVGLYLTSYGSDKAYFKFNPNQVSTSFLCVGPTASAACSGTSDRKFAYSFESRTQRLIHEDPFTSNEEHVFVDPGAEGFAYVGVWDDLYADFSRDPNMKNSWAHYGAWLQFPKTLPQQNGNPTGPLVQMGGFVGIRHLGNGSASANDPQALFSLPVQDIGNDPHYVFQGESHGLYVVGRSSADTSVGEFDARVRLEYKRSPYTVEGVVSDFRFEPRYGAAPTIQVGVAKGTLATPGQLSVPPLQVELGQIGVINNTSSLHHGMSAKGVANFLYQEAGRTDGLVTVPNSPAVPDGQWMTGFFNLDIPKALTNTSDNKRGSFATGVWQASWDWMAYDRPGNPANKGGMVGSFLTSVQQDLP